MLLLLLIAALLFSVYRLWLRAAQLAAAVESLSARVAALELSPVGDVATPVSTPVSTPPPAPVSTPVSPPVSARGPASAGVPQPLFPQAIRPADSAFSWESAIGSRWLLYIGMAAVVIAGAYFQNLAIDRGWINETLRVIEGALVGAGLVVGGRYLERRGYRTYGQIVIGGGVALLYVSIYSAAGVYRLVGPPFSFVLMVAITVLAARLAHAHRSQGLALMAVAGGFATPFLLPLQRDPRLLLFPYDAALVAGTLFLASRHSWPALNVASYLLTVLTFVGWGVRYYTPAIYLSTELFLTLFCAMFLVIWYQVRGDRSGAGLVARVILATAPWLYYVASIVVLLPHPRSFAVYLMAVSIAGAAAGARLGAVMRSVAWAAVAFPLLIWAGVQAYTGEWVGTGLVAVGVVYVVNLLAHFEATLGTRERPGALDVALIHLNAYGSYAAAYLLINAHWPSLTPAFTLAFAAWYGLLTGWRWLASRDHALQFAAVGLAALATAIGLQFDGLGTTIGWATEGAALVWLGLRERRDWLRAGGATLFVTAALYLLGLQFSAAVGQHTLVVNRRGLCSLVLIGLCYAMWWLHRRSDSRHESAAIAALAGAQVLTLAFVTSEIRGSVRDARVRDMLISLAWALQATALIVAGIRYRFAAVRYMALVLFALTVGKVMLYDLSGLSQVYRVASVLGLGVTLLITSYLYNRYRNRIA